MFLVTSGVNFPLLYWFYESKNAEVTTLRCLARAGRGEVVKSFILSVVFIGD